ncbi:hypothetical protein OJAV_G00175700 [Oryzias javanicus]|uniref:ATP-dependent RNA helicase DHX30 n=1 Tax=Oryzias javanicus TaxID=123683 RepID=A0A437CFX1_ORYJA|nr:hypothetical protein OJAV_G00175700 [Oryzias javanicus]
MALAGVFLVRLRTLCRCVKCFHTGAKSASNWSTDMRWYGTKARRFPEHGISYFQNKAGSDTSNLLKEFPDPKGLLNNTISRSLGVSDLSEFIHYSCTEHQGIKRATVTLLWPCKIEKEGFASKKTDAERFAAAAACLELREIGVIGPNNELPRRRAGRGRGEHPLLHDGEDEPRSEGVSRTLADESLLAKEDSYKASEALSMFPHSKSLLTRVIQVATTSSRIRELMQFKTSGRKLKRCDLTLLWPEKMVFTATASQRVTAERKAAALACMKLKELELLDKDNNPLTHAKYHREKVKEAGERERRPLPLRIPEDLEESMRDYLAQYPVAAEVQTLWEEEETRGQLTANQEEEELDEEDILTDAITGRRYRPLSEHEARRRSLHLLEEWERADPGLSVALPVDEHRQRVISADIRAVQDKLEERPHFCSGSHMILPLHSSLSVGDQQRVFQRPPEGQRKIVLATNIAETSITIDDIVHVVDAGTHKEQNYDARTKVSCLDTVWISRSNVTQRKGRAGRCQPGQSYHLFPRKQLESMSPFPVPEILRTPLESLVLQAKIHSPNCKAVDFLSQVLDSPDKDAVRDAVQTLQEIGVLDKTESLTPLGERVACMSCDPRLGKVLVLSAMFRCVLPMLCVAACLTRDPFHNSLQNRAPVRQAKEALSSSSHSDYLVFSRAVLGWRKVQLDGNREDRDSYLDKYTLSRGSLRFINGLISQFSENLLEAGLVSRGNDCQRQSSLYNEHSGQDELLKAVLLAGLYPNLIQVKKGVVTKGGRFRPNNLSFRTLSGPVLLHRSSVNRGKENLPSRWLTFFSAVKSNGNVFIRDSSSVHPLALLLFTDCDLTETVNGDRVEVSFHGRSLMRLELSVDTWELLWELRTSVQTMLYRNLNNPGYARTSQDGKLLSLIVELLNVTDSSCLHHGLSRDDEVD